MKSYGERSLQKTDTINLALNIGSEKIDRDQSKLIKEYKLLSERRLQGLINQRERTVVTIFRLANTSRISSSGLGR